MDNPCDNYNEETENVRSAEEFQETEDKMDSFDFTGLENEESDQVEFESKDIDFELGQQGHIHQHEGNATPTRRDFYRIISSGSYLKSVASVAGIWQSSNRCCAFVSILILMPLVLLVLIGESLIVFVCKKNTKHYNDTFCGKTRGYVNLSASPDHGQDRVFELARFLSVAAQVFCFVAMCISMRKSRFKSQALSLEQAYKLVRPSEWVVVNVQLLGFLILLMTSNVLNFCCSLGGMCDRSCDPWGAIFYALLSIMLWLTVVSCLIYATAVKGAIAQAHHGNEKIMEMEGGTVNDAIEIHQRFCKIGMHTIKMFHVWFLLNSACYFWLIVYLLIMVLLPGLKLDSWIVFYHFSVLLFYSLFAALHPWITAARLTRTYGKLTRKLNTRFQWKPNHPFNDRSKLDSFILYAANTQCQFSQITCSSSLPYISVILALCGLGLRHFQ